jgi:hypothetical protein
MSYALVVYSVPLGELREFIGSGDEYLLEVIEEEAGEFLDEINEIFADEEEEERLTSREALRHILRGGPYREGCDALYLYAVEAICRTIGSYLDNRAFQPPIRWGWVTYVDRFLESLHFPLRVADLACGGVPFSVPCSDVLPSIGCWPREHFAEALAFLENYKPNGLNTDLAEALASIIGWLDEALKHEDDFLIGIYS